MQEMWVPSLGHEDSLDKEWQPAPVFLPGEFQGQRILVGYSSWSCKGLDITEQQTVYRRTQMEGQKGHQKSFWLHFSIWNEKFLSHPGDLKSSK